MVVVDVVVVSSCYKSTWLLLLVVVVALLICKIQMLVRLVWLFKANERVLNFSQPFYFVAIVIINNT